MTELLSDEDLAGLWSSPTSKTNTRRGDYEYLVRDLSGRKLPTDLSNTIRSTLDRTFYLTDDNMPASLLDDVLNRIEASPTVTTIVNDKNSDYGTLFPEEVSESFEEVADDSDEEYQTEVEHGVVYQRTNSGSRVSWKSRGVNDGRNFTQDEYIVALRKRIFRTKTLMVSQKDDLFSQALVFLAEYQVRQNRIRAKFPWKIYRSPEYVATLMVNKTIDQFKYDNAKKRREVDMTFVADYDTVPVEWVQQEHDTFDEEFSHLSLTQKKALMDFVKWNDSAPEGEKPPKALRQRIQRVPKLEYSERVTTFAPEDRTVRGLRDSWPEEFPVTTSKAGGSR